MDWNNMKYECPWVEEVLSKQDREVLCKAGGLCNEDNCAPFHWVRELRSILSISVTAQIDEY